MITIIVAHGSKVAETHEIMLEYMESLKSKRPNSKIDMCYLQLMNPLLDEVLEKHYESGERDFVVFPFFIFNGNHIKEDIPMELEKFRQRHADVNVKFLDNIGFDDKISDLIIERTNL